MILLRVVDILDRSLLAVSEASVGHMQPLPGRDGGAKAKVLWSLEAIGPQALGFSRGYEVTYRFS